MMGHFSLDGDRSLHGPCSRTRRSPCRKKAPLRYCCDVYNSCACSVGFWVPGLTLCFCTALKASKLQSTDEAKTSRTACDDSFGISVTYCPEAPRPRLSVCNAYKLHEPLKARCILVPNHQSFSARGERVLTDKDRAQFLTF